MPQSSNLDVQTQVLKELTSPSSFQWNPKESYVTIAKKLGIDEETVRLAVKRAKESGFVERRVFLNPNLLGQKSCAVQLEIGRNIDAKSEMISQIKLIDGVVLIFDFLGNSLRIVFNYETDKDFERKIELI
jgi:DNA-binding Lrp family transcriptional regulator